MPRAKAGAVCFPQILLGKDGVRPALWSAVDPTGSCKQDNLGVVPVGEHLLEVGEVLCPESWKENGTHLRGCACRWHRHPILVVQGAPLTWGLAGLEPFFYPGPSALSTRLVSCGCCNQ